MDNSSPQAPDTKRRILIPLTLGLIALVCAVRMAGGLNGAPLFGGGDTAVWEFMGNFFAENVRFFPYPRINFTTDTILYPFGGSIVFQAWSAERELFYTIFSSMLGVKSALSLYFTLSLLTSCLGAYFIFRKQFGETKAAITGFVVAFFNFYAMAKFPGHLNISAVHWTTLSICLDYLIIYRMVGHERFLLRHVLLRALLLFLCVGQELGYVAGYGLLSFVFMLIFVAIYLAVHFITTDNDSRFFTISSIISNFIEEFQAHKKACITIIAVLIPVAIWNVAIDLQIVMAVKAHQTPFQGGSMWSSPFRLLIPWFPGFNPAHISESMTALLGSEWSEGLGANSPGYFLLALAGVSAIFSTRRMASIFLLGLFLVAITNNPNRGLSVNILPWLEYARVGSRISIILAPVLALMGLSFPLDKLKGSRLIQGATVTLVALALTELFTFASIVHYKPSPERQDFTAFMQIVRETPGEAVLDWPFCIAGGNGMGTGLLGRYYGRNGYTSFLNRYHGKKVVGLYAGRLTYEHIQPFVLMGLDKLMVPDNPDFDKAKRQRRPMTGEEWKFFDAYYSTNDFAGIILYPDLIHPQDINRFYKRFGNPIAETRLPGVKKVVFIPKDEMRRARVNKAQAQQLVYLPQLRDRAILGQRPPTLTPMNFARAQTNLGEVDAAANGSFILFSLARPSTVSLTVAGNVLNGAKAFLQLGDQGMQLPNQFNGTIAINGTQGINALTIKSDKPGYNVFFKELRLTPVKAP